MIIQSLRVILKTVTGLMGLIFIATIFLQSCSQDEGPIHYPDVSGVITDSIEFYRYDRIVASMNSEMVQKDYMKNLTSIPNFTDLYFKRLLAIPAENQDSFYNRIGQFLQAEEIRRLQDTIDDIYPDLTSVEEDFREAFKYLKYYFPGYSIPNVYFMQTEFAYQTILFSDLYKDGIGIGLDLFLGDDFDYKHLDPQNPAFSDYLTRSYNRDHIVRKSLAMILDDLMGNSNGRRFIDLAIQEGKKLYCLRRMLPMCHDTLVLEFSMDQLEWLRTNELEIWSYFLEEDMIYETNHLKIDKFVNPSPHSPGMPPEAPGRTGSYIGLQIVEKFMSENPEMDIPALLEESDSQKIMEMAKYKPRRR